MCDTFRPLAKIQLIISSQFAKSVSIQKRIPHVQTLFILAESTLRLNVPHLSAMDETVVDKTRQIKTR